MQTPAINVQNLCKNYGPVQAVDDVTFSVAPGELVGFLGPNGAGKSTCMRILTTWLPASSGYAWLNGFDVMYQSMEVRKQIGYLPESVPVYGEMRVREYLAYRAKLKGVDRHGRAARIDHCMEKGRVQGVANRLLSTLSKGFRQRVGLADTLLADPPILILDEPTSGLDPVQISETLATIKGLGGQHTILFSTHVLPEVEKVYDRVIIIDKGHIRFDETKKAIESREASYLFEVRGPADAVTAFLRDQPELASAEPKALEPDLTSFELRTRDRKDPRELLAARVAAKGWGLRRVEILRPSLEAIFDDVVRRRQQAETAPAPTGPTDPAGAADSAEPDKTPAA